MGTVTLGLLVVIVAGMCNALFAGPMKKMVKWEWENQWGMWAVWALLVSAWSFALLTVPDLFQIYGKTDSKVILYTILLGLGGGIGMTTCGKGLQLVGFSLGFSIILGLSAVTGSLLPMLILTPETVATFKGLMILVGLVVTVVGVAWCGSAGMLREKSLGETAEAAAAGSKQFIVGLFVCIVSAVFNAMINLSFAAGAPIAELAKTTIEGPAVSFRATNAVWALGMTGAFVPNAVYCGWLLIRKGTYRNFSAAGTGTYWFWTLVMGVVWMSGYALYGASTTFLGKLGPTVGWIVFFAMTIVTGNVMGFVTGEWAGAPQRARGRMKIGIVILLISIVIVGLGAETINLLISIVMVRLGA